MTAIIHSQATEETENGLMSLWNSVSEFLHNAQLIPLVVVVEGYHYYVVLSSHDSLWAAIPLALFLDLLHFRTVKQAIETKKVGWIIGATLSTVVAYAFQFIFYSSPGQNGHVLDLWKQLLFAAVVPLGITFMVWHHHENGMRVVRDWISELRAAISERDSAQDGLAAAKDEIQKMSAEMAMAKEKLDAVQDENKVISAALDAVQDENKLNASDLQLKLDDLKVVRGELEVAQRDLKMAQDENERVCRGLKLKTDELEVARRDAELAQSEVDVARPMVVAWQALSLRVQLAAQVKAEQLSLKDAAEQAGVSESTMRRDIGGLGE